MHLRRRDRQGGVAAGADGLIIEVHQRPGARDLRWKPVAHTRSLRQTGEAGQSRGRGGRPPPGPGCRCPGGIGHAMNDEDGFFLQDAKIAIVGLGLMGGSLALALKGKCAAIFGVARTRATRELALPSKYTFLW